jgi:hypothetical protein
MNLSDREILELNELCGAIIDGRATDAQRERVARLLRASEAARRFYVRALGQSASLQTYAAEMHADAPTPRVATARWPRFPVWVPVTGLAAAAVIGFFFVSGRNDGARGTDVDRSEFVARLTAEKGAQWKRGSAALAPGASLRKGQRIELESGYAEITFDSGARIVLEGAGELAITSAWDLALRRGTLRADVPPQAIGFRVTNRFVDVIDLGTEFTMIADESRGAEVLVNKGEVEAAPRLGGEAEAIVLRENEARRFGETGVSNVELVNRKSPRLDPPPVLERFVAPARFVHWSFDEAQGASSGEGTLVRGGAVPMLEIMGTAADDGAVTRTEGRRQRALRLDGQRYASGPVPGISGSMPRTVAFWVKVPEDAQPVDTWMVAWGTQLPKLGRRPVHIGWNRRLAEGALGALRTDFGGGYAIGTTNLRDGNWHHVVVFFSPGDDRDSPVEVKQYVDGRLESSTIVRDTLSPRAGTGDATIVDTVWLGYRLTGSRQEGRRFRGELDELFIFDRALQPHEIVSIMTENRLPEATLALNR